VSLTAAEFKMKWSSYQGKESAAYQEHFMRVPVLTINTYRGRAAVNATTTCGQAMGIRAVDAAAGPDRQFAADRCRLWDP
jgi:hypothetical protein